MLATFGSWHWVGQVGGEEVIAVGCPLTCQVKLAAAAAALIELHLPFAETSRTASARDTHTIGGMWQVAGRPGTRGTVQGRAHRLLDDRRPSLLLLVALFMWIFGLALSRLASLSLSLSLSLSTSLSLSRSTLLLLLLLLSLTFA